MSYYTEFVPDVAVLGAWRCVDEVAEKLLLELEEASRERGPSLSGRSGGVAGLPAASSLRTPCPRSRLASSDFGELFTSGFGCSRVKEGSGASGRVGNGGFGAVNKTTRQHTLCVLNCYVANR